MKNQLITENYTPALRDMKVGDTLTFPVKAHTSIKHTLIPRVKLELCVEGAEFAISDVDKKTGTFEVKRIA